MNFSEPFSITIEGKTMIFRSSVELWNWCINNRPDWVLYEQKSNLENYKTMLSEGISLSKEALDQNIITY